jgi:RNA polymerase sigma-70 factor, ECF subfamily
MSTADFDPAELERFRSYLAILAREQITGVFRAHVAPSDIVNQTLFEAHRARGQYRGRSDGELAAWLRQALVNNLADAFRKLRAGKRDVTKQISLNEAVERSNGQLIKCLEVSDASPSGRVTRSEELLRLSDAIMRLPESQRSVVELYRLREMPLSEVAAHVGKSEAAVGGLLHRAMKQLRQELV